MEGKKTDAFFFFRHFSVLIDETVRHDRISVPKSSAKGIFLHVKVLMSVFPFFWKILLAPKGSYVFFNHTGRVRKGHGRVTSLYLERILADSGRALVFDENSNAIEYPNGVQATQIAGLNAWIFIFSRFFPREKRSEFVFITQITIWSLILRWLKPRSVFFLVWYFKLWLIAACKNVGVKSIELQHGLIYAEHPYYQFDSARIEAGAGYLLPDEVWCYGEYWKEVLLANGMPPQIARVEGYFCDTGLKQKVDFPFVVYISIAESPIELKQLIAHIKPELRRRGWKLVIAPHSHVIENVQVHYGPLLDDVVVLLPHLDSYDLIRNSEAVVAAGSTMLWECIPLKKPAYLLNVNYDRYDYWETLLGTGFVRQLNSNEFPEPFSLPDEPEKEAYFFADYRWPLNP